jgi:hypothetical protein
MSVLDRVLVCPRWDQWYKKASCETLTRVSSDHCPLIVNTEDHRFKHTHSFCFETAWLTQEGFRDLVISNWPKRDGQNIQDYWKEIKTATQIFCKGWGANFNSQIKKDRRSLLEKIREVDKEAEIGSLSESQWQQRYEWERHLEGIYRFEEIQWQIRSGERWILKGDTNSRLFHSKANGQKKKCTIFTIEGEAGVIQEPKEIREHIEKYYKNLFGKEQEGTIGLSENFWSESGRLTEEEAADLIKPFTIKELEEALKDMDVNSAPGPDGLPVGFYREFWNEVKPIVLEMFHNLYRGELNLSRLNYGMISLIPKVKDASNIKQYRPICLLNVDYKWFTKVLTMRLTPHAERLISKTQTAFIPGRYILEGVVILHEILHEMRTQQS